MPCDEYVNGEIHYPLPKAPVLIEMRRRAYNPLRPHSSLGYRPSAPERMLPRRAASVPLRLPPWPCDFVPAMSELKSRTVNGGTP